MKPGFIPVIALLLASAAFRATAAPLALCPDNPHYFLFRGKPTVLITSGEHYGAVLNLDFDYLKYLDALAADGLNLTRTFSGSYIEPQGAFNIAEQWLDVVTGRSADRQIAKHPGGPAQFQIPEEFNECALKVVSDAK